MGPSAIAKALKIGRAPRLGELKAPPIPPITIGESKVGHCVR
jgi:hypothetical protein